MNAEQSYEILLNNSHYSSSSILTDIVTNPVEIHEKSKKSRKLI